MNSKISARIIYLVQQGSDLRDAFDQVLGEGQWDKVAGELYEALRK